MKAAVLLIAAVSLSACAGMSSIVVGTHAWFERREPDLRKRATLDLACDPSALEFVSVSPSGNDYREVEAHGCGKKVRYTYVKVGFAESWPKSAASTEL